MKARILLGAVLLVLTTGCRTNSDRGSDLQGKEYNNKFRKYAQKKSVTPDKVILKGKVPEGITFRIRARKFATSKPAEWLPNKCYPNSPKDPILGLPMEYTNAESIGYFTPKYSNGEYSVTIDFSLIDDLPPKCLAKKSIHIELITDRDEYEDHKKRMRKDNYFRVALYEVGFEGPHYNERVEPGKSVNVECSKTEYRVANKSDFDCPEPASPGIVTRYSEAISGALTNKAEYIVDWTFGKSKYVDDRNISSRDKAEISRIQNALRSGTLNKAEKEVLIKRLQEIELLIKAENPGDKGTR